MPIHYRCDRCNQCDSVKSKNNPNGLLIFDEKRKEYVHEKNCKEVFTFGFNLEKPSFLQ